MAPEAHENRRLQAVRRYSILDTPPDGAYDRIAALATRTFGVPMASVTLVDEDRIWIKAQQGLPGMHEVGREPGLCASAILQDEPYIVTDARSDPRTAGNSLVREGSVQFYAAAPIVTCDGYRLGTVNILDSRPRQVTGDELATLQDFAAIVSDELELRLSAMRTVRMEHEARLAAEKERAVLAELAGTLQRTLLPPDLPEVAGLETAAYYHIASATDQVGGDFYDLFPLDGGRWGFFLGDVCGKGSQAAALTSLVRYTLRTAVGYEPDPVRVLSSLDTVLQSDHQGEGRTEEPRFCTLLFGILDRHDDHFTVSLAGGGHPPALAMRADNSVEPIHLTGSQPVGIVPDPQFTAVTTSLAPGDTLLLYSDGLTEARLPGGAMVGEDRLGPLLDDLPGTGAQDLVSALTYVLEDIGGHPTDDVALLALGVPRVPPGAAGTGPPIGMW